MGLCACNLKESWSVQTVFTKERFQIKYALAEAATNKTFVESLKSLPEIRDKMAVARAH